MTMTMMMMMGHLLEDRVLVEGQVQVQRLGLAQGQEQGREEEEEQGQGKDQEQGEQQQLSTLLEGNIHVS